MVDYKILSQDTSSIAVRFFEDDAVVYGVVSGETHLIGIPAARLLEAVVAGCSDIKKLERIFAGNGPGAGDTEVREQIADAIAEFERLGLLLSEGPDNQR